MYKGYYRRKIYNTPFLVISDDKGKTIKFNTIEEVENKINHMKDGRYKDTEYDFKIKECK